jgi:hypothetical protein
MDDLFQRYAATPRSPSLAPGLAASHRKAWLMVVGAFAAALAIGIPFSFWRARGARTWEPHDMLVAGAIVAIFTVPIAMIGVVIFRRYLKLFREGRMVEAVVILQKPAGCVLQVAVGVGPDHTFIPQVRLPIGERLPAIVGDEASSLALVVVAPGDVRRGSLLTEAQIAPTGGG